MADLWAYAKYECPMGIWFLAYKSAIFCPIWIKVHLQVPDTTSYKSKHLLIITSKLTLKVLTATFLIKFLLFWAVLLNSYFLGCPTVLLFLRKSSGHPVISVLRVKIYKLYTAVPSIFDVQFHSLTQTSLEFA